MYKLHIELPGLPRRTNNQFQHWRAKKAHADKWKMAVILAIGQNIPTQPLTKAKLTLIRHSSRTPDFDGLVSSFKAAIDGLKYAKVIIDDNMDIIGIPDYRHVKCKQLKGKIEIIVEQIE